VFKHIVHLGLPPFDDRNENIFFFKEVHFLGPPPELLIVHLTRIDACRCTLQNFRKEKTVEEMKELSMLRGKSAFKISAIRAQHRESFYIRKSIDIEQPTQQVIIQQLERTNNQMIYEAQSMVLSETYQQQGYSLDIEIHNVIA